MDSLKKIVGRWNSSKRCVDFSWDISDLGNNRFVYFFPIVESYNNTKIDYRHYRVHDVADVSSDAVNSVSIACNDEIRVGVYLKQFLAFSQMDSSIPSEQTLSELANNKEFIANVMIGHADIEYCINRTDCSNSSIISFELESNSTIAQGVLGYQYMCGKTVIKEAFPFIINPGKMKASSPFLIPVDSDIQVIPIDERFNSNIYVMQKKKTLLERVFK